MAEKSIQPVSFDRGLIDPKQLDAINVIMSKEVPAYAKKERPGKGGNSWTYLSHVWVTRTLQEGLQNLWDFQVLDWEVFRETITIKKGNSYDDIPSVSVAARCAFDLWIIIDPDHRQFQGDPLLFQRRFIEVGVFEKMPSMPTAMAVASAVSRGLCRCVMRSLGLGLDLYGDDDHTPDANEAWTSLKQFAINQGVKWDDEFQAKLVDALQANGITRENIVDLYGKAYNVLATLLGKVVEVETMPEIK